jgi:hypothetical protein
MVLLEFLPHCGLEVDSVFTKMSNKNISFGGRGGGEGGPSVMLTTLPPSCADLFEIWKPQLLGNLRASPGLYTVCFIFAYKCSRALYNYINI